MTLWYGAHRTICLLLHSDYTKLALLVQRPSHNTPMSNSPRTIVKASDPVVTTMRQSPRESVGKRLQPLGFQGPENPSLFTFPAWVHISEHVWGDDLLSKSIPEASVLPSRCTPALRTIGFILIIGQSSSFTHPSIPRGLLQRCSLITCSQRSQTTLFIIRIGRC